MKKKMSIAIDGPASAGKSTVAKIVAKELGYIYCDTGAMYRALTYKALKNHVDLSDENQLIQLLTQIEIDFKQLKEEQLVYLDGENITQAIRENDVTRNVSLVASHKLVRQELVKRQQSIAQSGGIVMDGRDIGTAVLPNAELKIFLVASVAERAERRYKENLSKGISSDYEVLKSEIEKRDYYDSNRKESPLIQAEDAKKIDTTGMSIQEVVHKILSFTKIYEE